MTLSIATITLRRDEPAWDLREMNLAPPDYGPPHRYQIIHVVRNDKLVEHRTDMGLASAFGDAKQLNIIGGTVDDNGRGHVWETVASLMDYADNLRGRRYDWDDIPAMTVDDYANAFEDEQDKQKRRLIGRKTTGALRKQG